MQRCTPALLPARKGCEVQGRGSIVTWRETGNGYVTARRWILGGKRQCCHAACRSSAAIICVFPVNTCSSPPSRTPACFNQHLPIHHLLLACPVSNCPITPPSPQRLLLSCHRLLLPPPTPALSMPRSSAQVLVGSYISCHRQYSADRANPDAPAISPMTCRLALP